MDLLLLYKSLLSTLLPCPSATFFHSHHVCVIFIFHFCLGDLIALLSKQLATSVVISLILLSKSFDSISILSSIFLKLVFFVKLLTPCLR